jgi:hypothetical protein
MSQNTRYVRWVAAVAVLVSAFVHLKLWAGGMKSLDVVGPAFLVNGVGGIVIAVLLVTWRHWVPGFLTLGFGLSTLGAFVLATLPAGFFGVHERWVGGYVWAAAIAEATAIVTGALLLLATTPLLSGLQPEHRPAVRGAHLH